jgi:hypothetical protein
MKCHPGRAIAFVTLFLVPYLVVVRSSASAEPVRPEPANPGGQQDRRPEDEWADRVHHVRPLEPGETLRDIDPRRDLDQPPVREQEAVLPDPPTGRELVDRVLVEAQQGRLIPVLTTSAAGPPKVYHRYHVAPQFVLPIPTGT